MKPSYDFRSCQEVEKEMLETTYNRHKNWTTTYVPTPEDFPISEEKTIVGVYSRTYLKTKRRILLTPKCLFVYPHEGIEELETPTTLARDYLTLTYKQRHVKKEQAEIIKGQFMPIYAKPCVFEYGYYVDIKSAWWSILKIAGWDVDYYPGHWLGSGRPPLDFPYSYNKLARSALVSVSQSLFIPVFDPVLNRTIRMSIWNKLLNQQIYCLISHILNSIALEAVDLGCVYVNTDGFICPDLKTADQVNSLIKTSWGLDCTCKEEGQGWVKGVGCYRVGHYKTKRDMEVSPLKKIAVEHPYDLWVWKRWAKMVEERKIS